MRHTLLLGSLVLSLALAAPALAKPPSPPPRPGAAAPGDVAAMRTEVRARLRAHRTAQLVDALALDEAGAARLMPVLRRFDDQLEPIVLELGTARRELKAALTKPSPDATLVNAVVDRMLAGREKLDRLSRERLVELRKVLSPPQFGRAVLVLAQIDRKVDKHLHKAMRKAMRGRGPGIACDPADPLCDRTAGKPGKPGKMRGRRGGRGRDMAPPMDPFAR